jgi:TP53 regulating kinase-like protein
MIIARGAEAVLEREGDLVLKKRIPKTYRHPKMDAALRKARTRREAKVIAKLPVAGPELVACDQKETITMRLVEGEKLADCLDQRPELVRAVARSVAGMHDAGIIHGDLTTSNMIAKGGKVVLIDFGLSFFSTRVEDKAVDLHLFSEALQSKHYRIAEKAFKDFLLQYRPRDRQAILDRLRLVEARGRYKGK